MANMVRLPAREMFHNMTRNDTISTGAFSIRAISRRIDPKIIKIVLNPLNAKYQNIHFVKFL